MSIEAQLKRLGGKDYGFVYYFRIPDPPKHETVDGYYYEILQYLKMLRNYNPHLLPKDLLGISSHNAFSLAASKYAYPLARLEFDFEHNTKRTVQEECCILYLNDDYMAKVRDIELGDLFLGWL